jgi:site-specific DNA-methyltransferase (adenine-specific)
LYPLSMPPENVLFYGNNLDVLRNDIEPESVDLVYLDPPFNSNATYNVLFRGPTGEESQAQIEAFEDTWHWNDEAEAAFDDVMRSGNSDAANMLRSIRSFLGDNDMMAYLAMMAVRLLELHRVLKSTGSIYLHCDPTASHYLKVLLDAVFGPMNFRSEVIWRRSSGHNKVSRQYGPIHDTILFYAKTDDAYFQPGYTPVARGYVKEWFTGEDERGPFRTNMLTGPGTRTGSSGKPWRNFDPTSVGRHWAIPKSLRHLLPPEAEDWNTQQCLDHLHGAGFIYIPREGEGQPKYKQYLGAGIPYQDVWAYQPYTQGCLYGTEDAIDEDVKWLQHDQERLGYPTQKPEGLLARIIRSSCPQDGIVLDPFCGCGTTIAAAQSLGRRWLGIDITHLAIGLIERRLRETHPGVRFRVEGTPKDFAGAEDLAVRSKHQFQMWAVSLIYGVPYKGGQRGADSGIDGYYYCKPDGRRTEAGIIQVKGGENLHRNVVGELRGVIERERAPFGILITLRPPTGPMSREATAAGFFETAFGRLQIITVEDLLDERFPKLPPQERGVGFRRAREDRGQGSLL